MTTLRWNWVRLDTDNRDDIQLISIHSKGSSAFKAINFNIPDVVIIGEPVIDYPMFELISKIKHRYPTVAILTLTDEKNPSYLHRIYNLAEGIMDRSGAFSLNEAITLIKEGKQYIQPDISFILIDYYQYRKVDLISDLTNREYEVLKKVTKGVKCETISSILSVSRRTITEDKRQILKKLNMDSFDEINKVFDK